MSVGFNKFMNIPNDSLSKKIKAVGLLSGGLDSFLSAKIVRDQGIEVTALFCALPWGCGEEERVRLLCQHLGLDFHLLPLGEEYIEMLLYPRYGYGTSFNPCLDCHIFMINKAAEYMREIGADFIFTGEVVGQRPMSQRRDCFVEIDKQVEIASRLLRPLSAKLLPPTVMETNGWIDREKLFGLSGRSRKFQMSLAREWGLEGFSAPGGGCLLTDDFLGRRIKDFLEHRTQKGKSMVVLRWGRYFRLDAKSVVLIGRDEKENAAFMKHAISEDSLLEMRDVPGPVGLLRTENFRPDLLVMAAGLVQWFSKYKTAQPQRVYYRRVGTTEDLKWVTAARLSEEQVKALAL